MTWLLSGEKTVITPHYLYCDNQSLTPFGILLFCVYRMIKTEVQHEPDAEGLKIAKEEPGILQHEPEKLIKPKEEPGVLQHEPDPEGWIKPKEEPGILQHEPGRLIKPKKEPGVLQPEPETEIWIKPKEESGVLQHEPEPEGLMEPKEEPGVLQVLERLEDASETMLSR